MNSLTERKGQLGEENANLGRAHSFPVVAIGASAGNLAAITALLKALPPNSGMAFVLVHPFEPKRKTALNLLSKATVMPVVEVSDGILVEPDHVYFIPPNKGVTIRKGTLHLSARSDVSGRPWPFDDFAAALAEEQGNAAIGVVLSGTGSDGTQGLKVIKAAGGVTFAQDPKTAEWPSMPMSAIAAGSVDFVLSPQRIAEELAHRRGPNQQQETAQVSSNEELLCTKEELETAREELESSNKELAARNDELQRRNRELNLLTQDLGDLLADVDIPVLVLDAGLRVRRFTPLAGKLLNLIQGDIGRPFSNIASRLDVADWKDVLSEVTGKGRFIEREVSSRDGHRYSLHVRPHRASDSAIDGLVMILLDTESISRARDRAQESADSARAGLDKSESTIRALLEATPQSIVGVRNDGTIGVVNGATERMFGYRREELIGQPVSILIPENVPNLPAGRPRIYFTSMQNPPLGINLVLEGRRRDGTLFPVEIGLSAIETPAGKLGVAFVSDITERRRMEQAAQAHAEEIRESEERFRKMADDAPVLIWASGPDMLCIFFNKGWLDFTGRALEKELGNGWAEGVHPEDRERCWNVYSSSFATRRSFQMEYRLRRTDGAYRWILDKGVPRFDPHGGLLGYIGSAVDIQDFKQAHEEDLAKLKLETVGTLAEGIAHDFNNLLGGVLAQSELALAELASGFNPAEELERIRDAATRGAEIVRQLMVYAGEETAVVELVSISGIVEEMLELVKVSVSKQVAVETDLSKHLPLVWAIPAQVRQVVMNLFYNASEAIGDQEGKIRVSTKELTIGPDSPRGMAEGDYVQLEVSATGRGVTPEVQARVFEPFFTAKLTGSHRLGLTGSTVLFSASTGLSSFPAPSEAISTRPTPGPRANPQEETSGLPQATVLVVDDEALLREAVSRTLRKNGMSVIEANDGSFALDVMRAHKHHIDLLLLDITLPGASSREVYEEAKRLKRNLPVIVTSAKTQEMAAAALAADITHFLRKPFSLVKLLDMIGGILSRRSRFASS